AHRQSLDYSADDQPNVPHRVSWFSLVGGGTAWLLHLLAVYVISEFGCSSNWDQSRWMGVNFVAWMLIAATVATGGLAAAASWTAYRTGRLLRGSEGDRASVASETQLFVGRASLLLNGIFSFIILIQGVPIF